MTGNIADVTDAIDRMQGILKRYEQNIVSDTAAELTEIMDLLQRSVLSAEKSGDWDFLKVVLYKVLPEFDKIEKTFQYISQIVKTLLEQDIKKALAEEQGIIRTFLPNTVTHVVVDRLGNAGDYILGRSQRALVESSKTEPDDKPSWNIVHVAKEVTTDFIEACNRSSGVIIGGGGLFLRDSNTNEISGWQWPCSVEDLKRITSPVYVMGVGYNRFRGQEEFDARFTESINALVEKSSFFGLRNHGSVRAVRNYLREDLRDKVQFCPCATTVLSRLYTLPRRREEKPFIAVNCAFDRAGMRYGGRQDEVICALARVLKTLSGSWHIKCYIQCTGDAELLPYLDEAGVAYEKVDLVREMDVEEYLSYYTDPALVLAVRGHAQMIPFGCGTPAVSIISHDKLAWFLEDIGHPEWGVEVSDPDFEEKLLAVSEEMLCRRETICEQIEAAKEKLWNVLQEDLVQIRL